MKRNLFVFFLFGFLSFSHSALAINAQLHRPTTGQMGGYKVHTTETLEQGQLGVGVDFNFVDDYMNSAILYPLSKRNVDLGDQLGTFDFLVSYGLLEWLTFNMDLPVHFFEDLRFGPNQGSNGVADPGDMHFSLKARLFDPKENGIGLALIPFITAPTGDRGKIRGDQSATGGVYTALEKKWELTRLYANMGARFRRNERISLGEKLQHEFLYGVGLEQTLVKDAALSAIAEVIGSTMFDNELTSPAEIDFLLRKGWGDEKRLLTHAGAGFGANNGYGATEWRAFAGISYLFGGGKVAEAAPSASDTDGDGLLDDDEVKIYGTDPKNPDTDGDGLRDGEEVKNYKTDPKNPNTDGDGCKDGEEVKTYSTNPLKKDCPPAEIDLRGKINFKSGSAEILAASFPILDDAVAKMKAHPEIELVTIEGHTDSQGADAFNMNLSESRANSCKDYFVKKGVATSRLTTKGYGETKPVASNDTAAGRADNRRIVFRIERLKKK